MFVEFVCLMLYVDFRVLISIIYACAIQSKKKSACKRTHEKKGGDKLTLNLTGSSNLTKNTNAGQSNLASPLSKVFPSPPPSAGLKSETQTLLPLDTTQDTENRINPINGITPSSTADTVTVTHFSEKRGTMEKISVPSLNIFNAEFKAETSKSTPKSSTNPFLNTSPVAVTSTNTTNPFHVSLTTNSIEPELVSSVNDNFKTNDVISICSDNNNDTNVTLISKKDAPPKMAATNPFTVAIDEIDNDLHNTTDRIKTNNNDALNNLKNNNIVVNEKAEPSLDEKNKNMKNIEVI